MHIEAKLEELGLLLPEPMQTPPDLRLPFAWVRVRGNRAYVSGHIALNPDGSVAQPLGKVGSEVAAEEGYQSARRVALAHLASLKRALGDLDRVTAWLRVFAMVNVAPGFDQTPLVTIGNSAAYAHHTYTVPGRSRQGELCLFTESPRRVLLGNSYSSQYANPLSVS